MKQEKLAVRSITDVITNSSSEAYSYCTQYTFDTIKTIFNTIAALVLDPEKSGLSKGKIPEFDDYFEMYEGLYDESYVRERWEEEHPGEPQPDLDELFSFAESIDDNENEGSRCTGKLVIKAKTLKAKEVAEVMERMQDLFDLEVRYC